MFKKAKNIKIIIQQKVKLTIFYKKLKIVIIIILLLFFFN